MDVTLDGPALHEALNKARWERRLIWREAAEQIGVHPRVISELRHGRNPSATNLLRILVWLGTTDVERFIEVYEAAA